MDVPSVITLVLSMTQRPLKASLGPGVWRARNCLGKPIKVHPYCAEGTTLRNLSHIEIAPGETCAIVTGYATTLSIPLFTNRSGVHWFRKPADRNLATVLECGDRLVLTDRCADVERSEDLLTYTFELSLQRLGDGHDTVPGEMEMQLFDVVSRKQELIV